MSDKADPLSSPESEPELPLIEDDVLPTHDVLEEKRRYVLPSLLSSILH